MKSKSQLPCVDFGGNTGEKPATLPRKRQKVSARLSLEQSKIEDTPVLAALQAAKEDAPSATQILARPPDNVTELTYVHEKNHHHKSQPEDSDDEDGPPGSEELTGSLKLLIGEHATEEEKSRATRSRLHVDTIGLSSSTLGKELQN